MIERRRLLVLTVFWVGLLVLSVVTVAPAATYYVARSESGASDASDGLAPTNSGNGRGPWLTIRKALATARGGDTIFVGSGRYREEVSIATPRLRLQALNGARPLIDGENVRPYGIRNPETVAAQDVLIEGFEIANHTTTGVMIVGRGSRGVVIRGNIIHHARDKGITVRGTGHRIESNTVFMIGNKPDIVGEHLVIDGNLYYGPPGRPSFFYHVEWPRGGKPGLTTLEDMRRSTPFAANDINGIDDVGGETMILDRVREVWTLICVGVLIGIGVSVRAAASLDSVPAGGALRVHPDNPRYFTDGSGKAIYLTGAHTWNNFQYNGVYPRVGYDEYLDFLAKHNHNFIRLWAWEQGGWDPWAAGHVIVEPVAYLRTGPGNALDGKPKYDLTKFKDEYFERLRSRVAAAQKRGIYVSIMLFQGWSVEKKGQVGNPWQGHPFNKANNINGIDGDRNGNGQGPEIHTLEAPPEILELQKAYVRRIIDTVNDLNNVLYEIGNEMHVGSAAWQYRMIEFIHEYERTKPKQHPVGMTGAPIANAALFDSPADWISPTGGDGYNADPPPANGRKVIISDVDHVWPKQYRQWVWKSFTRGLNTAFMDLYGATRIGDKDTTTFGFVGDWVIQHDTVRKNLGYTRTLAERMNLAAMTPRGDLASSGYCLANPGKEYLVYQPAPGAAFTVDLHAGTYEYEWFDPESGTTNAGDSFVAADGAHTFTAPFRAEVVLHIRRRGI